MTRAFVGRRAELTQLTRALSAGPGRVALVEAESGFGKSALLDELVRRVPGTVVRASPIAMETAASWSVLRALTRAWDDLPAAVAVAVGRTPSDASVSAGDVAFAWTELLRAHCAVQTVTIVVDDLQWCDEASAAAIGIAMREVPCTWLLGTRPGATAIEVERLVPADRLSLVELGPMSSAELTDLIIARSSHRWSPTRIDEVVELCDGSPLLAVELVRELDTGRLQTGRRRGIAAVYEERLAAAPADELDVVSLAALAFRPTLALLAAARDGRPVVDLLAAAERRGIVRVDDTVGFVHPLCRHVVVERLGRLERAAIHRELATLEVEPEAVVRHLALGTLLPDAAVAERLEAAGIDVRRRGGAADAAWLFERASELTPSTDPSAERRRRARAGVAYADAEEIERAGALLADISGGIDDLDTDLRASVVAVIVMVADRQLGKPGADAAARRLLADAHDGRLRARLWRLIVRIHQYDDLREAEHLARDALADAERTGGSDEILGAEAVLANVRFLRGADVPVDDLLAELEASSAFRAEGTSAATLIQEILAWDDRFDEVRRVLAELLESASEDASSAVRADLLAQASYVELRAGDVALAEKLADEAVALVHPRPGVEAFSVAETLLPIHGLRGDRVSVDDWVVSTSLDVDDAPAVLQILFHANAGFARLSTGDLDAALHHLSRARDLSDRAGLDDTRSVPWASDLLDVQLLGGDLDGARSTVARLVRASERSTSRVVRADRLRAEGLVALAVGDLPASVGALEQAVEMASSTGRPLVLARCLLALGSALRRAGRRRDASTVLVRARRTFEQVGAEAWLGRVDDELRRAGYGGRSNASSAELTATERRIVDLVVVGRSNREIAAELFVTVRTVESNLTRIYRKLGVRGRTELVARERR